MNKQQIKARILQIINNTIGYIIADEIFNQLLQGVDPGRTQETYSGPRFLDSGLRC